MINTRVIPTNKISTEQMIVVTANYKRMSDIAFLIVENELFILLLFRFGRKTKKSNPHKGSILKTIYLVQPYLLNK